MRFWLLFLLGIFAAAPVKAGRPYIVSYYYSKAPIDLGQLPHFKFRPLSDPHQLRGIDGQGHYLFKILLDNAPPAEGALLFIENEHLDEAILYSLQANSLTQLFRAGNRFAATTSRFGLAQFRLSGTAREYLLLTEFQGDVSFSLKIGDATEMNNWGMAVFFELGLYYGVSLMFFLINLFLFLYLKDRVFLYYCFFQFFVVFTIAYADGLFAFAFSGRWLLNHADVPLHLGLALSGALFSIEFLGRSRDLFIIRVTGLLLGSATIAYVLGLIMSDHTLFLIGESLVLLLLCSFWMLAAGQFKQHMHSRFFVMGYGIFFLFALDYFLLRKLDIYVLDLYMGQLKTGSFIEMLVLSIAIVFRVNTLRAENENFRIAIERSMQQIADHERKEAAQDQELFKKVQHKYDLTDREVEVLRGIVDGLTNTQIADRIFLSVHTVKFHTRNIFDKLEITNRTQASGKLRA